MNSNDYVAEPSKAPLEERLEVGWKVALERFRDVIYPELFKPHGYTLAEAHILWSIDILSNDVRSMQASLDNRGF